MKVFRILWAAIKAAPLAIGIGLFVFLIAGIAQLILGLSDTLVMTVIIAVTVAVFLWLTYDNYDADKFEGYADASITHMKKQYKKKFGVDYVRDEKIPGIDTYEPKDEEYVVEDRWTGMPKYRIKNKASKDDIVVEDYWTGMPTDRIRKK